MIRRLVALRAAQSCAAVFLAMVVAGCGGNADVRVVSGNGTPSPIPGTSVSGQVRMPKGQVASAPASGLTRLAQLIFPSAEALSGQNILPVGAGVAVELFQVEPSDIVNGQIASSKFLADGDTDGSGFYQIEAPVDVSEATCHLMVQVGAGSSLTRAFVFSFSQSVDISFESETVVRLILAKVGSGQSGVSFCNFSNDDIQSLLAAVHNVPGVLVGDNAATVNQNAVTAALLDPVVLQILNSAGLTPTNTPTRVVTPTPTATNTPVPPTVTTTPSVTTTRTASPTVTHTNTASPTGTASASATKTNTVTATATNTVTVTATSSATASITPSVTPTNSPQPTSSPTNTLVPTVTPTDSPVPTSSPTNTSVSTATATPTSTTVVPSGNIDVGNGSGKPGDTVVIAVTLSNGGGKIAATSNDIVYDSSLVNVNLKVNGKPDCTIDASINVDSAASKTLVASQPSSPANAKILRVGIFGSDNANIIPDGPLFTCNFVIAAGAAPGAIVLTNIPGASDAGAQSLNVGGANGTITVNAAPTRTNTVAPTATPTTPAAAPPQLSQAIGASDTTIAVSDISGLPDSGTLLIGGELITYNGKQASGGGGGAASGQPGVLLNVQRGVDGTTASTHSADEVITVVPSGPSVDVGSGNGTPGTTVVIAVVLAGSNAQIAATSNDIVYDSSQVNVKLKVNGKPDCTIDPSINTDSAASKTLVASQPSSPANAKILRVGIFGSDNANIIPDGPLFTCNFIIDPAASAGAKALTNVPGASDAGAQSLNVSGSNGTILVAGGTPPTAAPTATAANTPSATNTVAQATATNTVPQPTATSTVAVVATATNTVPQATATSTVVVAATATNTVPQATATSTVAPPTATNTVAQATATNTVVVVPTNTNPPTATQTVPAATPTTPASGPAVNVGSGMGAPGATVSIPVTLANGGGIIAATSNDIVYDSSLVSVKLKVNGKPDCTIDASINTDTAASKTLVASQPTSPANAKILRVGIFGSDNANIIPNGPLFACNFVIAANAAGTIILTNVPGASDAGAQSVNVAGSNGSILVVGPPTPTPTTAPVGPAVNVGSTSGATGASVTLAVTLANSGGIIAATSNDIVYDSSLVNVKLKVNGKPDCTIDASINTDSAASKSLVASQPTSPANAKILRVGIFGSDNANIIPDGPLFSCNFTIAAGATGIITLTNVPGASDAGAQSVVVGGSNGSITVL